MRPSLLGTSLAKRRLLFLVDGPFRGGMQTDVVLCSGADDLPTVEYENAIRSGGKVDRWPRQFFFSFSLVGLWPSDGPMMSCSTRAF